MKGGAEKLDDWEARGRTGDPAFSQLLYKVAKDYAERGLYEWARQRLARKDFYDLIRPGGVGLDFLKLRLEVFLESIDGAQTSEDLFLYDLQTLSGWLGRLNGGDSARDEWRKSYAVFRSNWEWRSGHEDRAYLGVNEAISASKSRSGSAFRRLLLLRGTFHVERNAYGEAMADLEEAVQGLSEDLEILIPGNYGLFRASLGLGKFSTAKKHLDALRDAFVKRDSNRKFEGWVRRAEAEFKAQWAGK